MDRRYREADKLVVVMDQLNTHSPASLYQAFTPAEAKRLADRLEIHHTPKHGSWLNMAEIELIALGRDLPERIGDRATLERHVHAWQHRRTPPPSGPIGSSPPRTLASSSVNSIRQ